MLTTVFGKAADLLDKRFLVGLFLPSVGFLAALGALVLTGIGWDVGYRFWTTTHVAGRWTLGVVIAAAVLLFAVFLGTQVTLLVQIWEGYWHPCWLGRLGSWAQKRRYDRLSGDSARRLQQYPADKKDFLPMRLGNVMLAAENYSRARYGLDSVYFWPRQYLALSADVRTIVDDARRALDQLVVIASLAVLIVLAALGLGLAGWQFPSVVSAPVLIWGPSALVAAAVASAAYRSSITAATVFGELVRSAFDLYRGDLLNKLGVPAPKTRALERQTWEALGQFLFRGGTDSRENDALIEYGKSPESTRSFQLSYRGLPHKKTD